MTEFNNPGDQAEGNSAQFIDPELSPFAEALGVSRDKYLAMVEQGFPGLGFASDEVYDPEMTAARNSYINDLFAYSNEEQRLHGLLVSSSVMNHAAGEILQSTRQLIAEADKKRFRLRTIPTIAGAIAVRKYSGERGIDPSDVVGMMDVAVTGVFFMGSGYYINSRISRGLLTLARRVKPPNRELSFTSDSDDSQEDRYNEFTKILVNFEQAVLYADNKNRAARSSILLGIGGLIWPGPIIPPF